MAVIPANETDQIEFCEVRAPVWLTHAAELGVDPAKIAELQAAADAALAAHQAALEARQASLAATLAYNSLVSLMRGKAAGLVGQIKANAQSAGDTRLLALAMIQPPTPRSRLSPPGRPSAVQSFLESDGGLTLSWKASRAAPSTGAFFRIQRRLAGERMYTDIGAAAVRRFKDGTLPVGTAAASYIITGYRGERAGESSAPLLVSLGVGATDGTGDHAARRAA